MRKEKFDSELRENLEKEKYPMPFWACGKGGKGHPLDARLLFVGFNPSSAPPNDKKWLDYWDAETGFDMAKYQRDQPKNSNTRKNIRRLAETTLGIEATYVNSNVFWTASDRKKNLQKSIPGELYWLIEGCQRMSLSSLTVKTHGMH